MSAITKPFIHSSRALGTVLPINTEKVLNFEKALVPSVAGSPAVFQINFSMEDGSAPRTLSWNYLNETLLDADMVQILIIMSTVTP